MMDGEVPELAKKPGQVVMRLNGGSVVGCELQAPLIWGRSDGYLPLGQNLVSSLGTEDSDAGAGESAKEREKVIHSRSEQ